jgi:molybdate-binding protein
VARRHARFVNRQRGSGTRALLDRLLKQAGIAPAEVPGYADEEFTHLAVAATVAAGRADASIGVRAAAGRFGVDFVPLTTERYWLVARRALLRDARLKGVIAWLRGEALRELAQRLTGYDVSGAGEVCMPDALEPAPRATHS